jgi:SAM-dependent MidA family methyltransferase
MTSFGLSTLPPLDLEESEHSARVEAFIRRRIAEAGGWVDFETFMDLALYAPGLGYYSAGSAKLGPAGDFVTAPELGELFSECVARQCAEILAEIGGGEIIEFGGGTGRMAAAVLSVLGRLGALPERYALLEVSGDLRARQQERIGTLARPLADRVTWLERWPETSVRGVVLANEVLDALPCQRFGLRENGIQTLGVGIGSEGALTEVERPAGGRVLAACNSLLGSLPRALPAGYRSEICLRIEPWIVSVGEVLERGAMLIFDYGLPRAQYYHPDRSDGTLRCHFRHRAHDDPLVRVGMQDITAWVDFTRVAEAADAAGLDVLGFATQSAFLLGTGIAELIARARDLKERTRAASEARRLLLPGEMGEVFKVMALGRGCTGPLRGFAHRDLRASLG